MNGRVLISGAAVLVSAALIFWVEPLFARKVLPLLGGSAGVWNTALVFYQGMLLAGYLYAHFAPLILGPRRHALVHSGLLAVPIVVLPLTVPDGWTQPPEGMPAVWLLGLFTVALGLPFFMLSSTAPLVQAWLGRSRGGAGSDPYFLYAISNVGSLGALLAFPLLLEPRLSLGTQAYLWSWGYGVAALLVGVCALAAVADGNIAGTGGSPGGLRGLKDGTDSGRSKTASAEGISAERRLRWTLLAFAPSVLLLSVTSHITTDLAAVPLLWVVPLAVYLLTYAMAFTGREWIPHLWITPLAVFSTLFLLLDLEAPGLLGGLGLILPLHLVAFGLIALACHQDLAQDRPPVMHLTEFYVWVSFGGILGGLTVAVGAPLVLESRAEYPAGLVLTAGLLAWGRRGWEFDWSDLAVPAAIGAVVGIIALQVHASPDLPVWVLLIVFGSVGAWILTVSDRPVRLVLGLGVLHLGLSWLTAGGNTLLRDRSFYGVLEVRAPEPQYHILTHGTTIHGAQRLSPGATVEPMSYYHRDGPLGDVFRTFRSARGPGSEADDREPAPTGGGNRMSAIGRPEDIEEETARRLTRIGVVGLGTGAMACYRRPGDRWTFFEIDPAVVRIARDTSLFRYLSECAPNGRIIIGDGRILLREESDGAYDLLVLDAFSSDAVPVHLLTSEAISLYLAKLAPDGMLVVHISNRYLELDRVVSAVALRADLVGRIRSYEVSDSLEETGSGITGSDWAVVAREDADLGSLAQDSSWIPLGQQAKGPLWTDDHSNLVSVLRW